MCSNTAITDTFVTEALLAVKIHGQQRDILTKTCMQQLSSCCRLTGSLYRNSGIWLRVHLMKREVRNVLELLLVTNFALQVHQVCWHVSNAATWGF